MTNDPTTTGEEQQATAIEPVIGVMVRHVKLELDGRFEVAIFGGWLWIVFFYGVPEESVETRIPLSRFKSEEEAVEWVQTTAESFKQNWGRAMGFETARHFNNIGRYVLYQMGRSPYTSLEEVIAEQVKQMEKTTREWFHLRVGRGNPSKWQSRELGDALLDILTKTKRPLKWDEVREELARREPDRTPDTGDALRVLAGRHGLKLRALRKDAAKLRREREEAKRQAQTRNEQ
jgi:hypothetical protein